MGGRIFHTSRAFVKCCFTVSLHGLQAFEVELCCVTYAIELAERFKWRHIRLECTSDYVV